jgi:aldose 1-epimerase
MAHGEARGSGRAGGPSETRGHAARFRSALFVASSAGCALVGGCTAPAQQGAEPNLARNAQESQASAAREPIRAEPFGEIADSPVSLYTLVNRRGSRARITNYGGAVVSLEVPDRDGTLGDVVLGYDTLAEYLAGGSYFGAIIGRYGNRIARGAFTLDGVRHPLFVNSPPNSLHGGRFGFDKKVWSAEAYRSASGARLVLHYLSPDGEEGYPGDLDVQVTYTLNDEDALVIDYAATTSADTVLNLTHHGYFNLAGAGQGPVLAELLQIHASRFTPVDATSIPTGELRAVAGTPFDFTLPTPIGTHISDADEQLTFGKGYDHNFVLDQTEPGSLGLAARVSDPASGRTLTVYTTEPGLQLYTGNHLRGTGKQGKSYVARSGLALEAQHFPDSPNQPAFPSTELKAGERYTQRTVYQFGIEGEPARKP